MAAQGSIRPTGYAAPRRLHSGGARLGDGARRSDSFPATESPERGLGDDPQAGSRPADVPADDRIRPVGVVGAWESRECLTKIAIMIMSSLGTASPLLVLSDRARLRRSAAVDPRAETKHGRCRPVVRRFCSRCGAGLSAGILRCVAIENAPSTILYVSSIASAPCGCTAIAATFCPGITPARSKPE